MAKSLAHNSIVSGLAAIATNLAGFLSTVIVARLVGVEGTGVVSFAAAIATITIAVFDLGIQTTLARFVPEVEATGDDDQVRALVWHLLRIFVAANLVLFLGLQVRHRRLYSLLRDRSKHALMGHSRELPRQSDYSGACTAAFCLVQALAFFETAYLKGRQRFRELTLISIISMIVQLCAVFVATWLYGIVGALLGTFSVRPTWPSGRCAIVQARQGPYRTLRERVMRFTSLTLAAQILSTLMTTRLEVIFLEWSWGSTAVGLFTVSLTLANMACVPMFLCTALLPHLSSLVGEDALERTRETYRYSLRLLAYCAIACMRFSSFTLAAQILSTLMTTRLEVIFLEWNWGSAAVGLFTVSLTLANMACVPIVPVHGAASASVVTC